MYANKFAVAVKHRGKVLQEFGEVVYLPFGSEYGLLLKNLNSVRASVKVSIDGCDVTENVTLVVPANGSIDLERFIKNGNLNAGNRFKFIERNAAVAAHRGVRIDDGLITIKWSFEVPYIPPPPPPPPVAYWRGGCGTSIGGISGSLGPQGSAGQAFYGGAGSYSDTSGTYTANAANGVTLSSTSPIVSSNSVAKSAPGITAPGSVSHQQFHNVGWFPTETAQHVMVIKLAGQASETGSVQNAVYTRTKVDCTVCGYKARPSSKFCSQCGASLNVIG